MSEKVTAYINAGGRGTRLNSVLVPHPDYGVIKALLEVGEPPIVLIDHHIKKMTQAAIGNIVVAAGDVGAVKEYVGKRYNNEQVEITTASCRRGNGGDLLADVHEHPELFAERILITNADTVLELDEPDFLSFQGNTGAPVSIALTRNKNVPNQDGFYVDKTNKVIYSTESEVHIQTKRQAARAAKWRGSSTGAVVVETDFIKNITTNFHKGNTSLYGDIIGKAISEKAVSGYDNGNKFFMDLGTVSTWLAAQDPDVLNPYLFHEK